jgi:protein SCO1
MRRRRGLLVAAGLLALAASLTDTTAQAGGRWGEGYFPNHEVITQDGERVAFYDDLIKGKRVVVSFIYTSCKDLCPINTARLAQVAEMLGDEVGRDVFFISISVDPQTDTPERLRAFKDAFYDRPGWTFITGDPEELREIGSSLGNNSPIPAQHRNEIILGNEANGEWARNTPFGDPVSLVFAIRDMDPEWRAEVRAPDTRFLSVEDYQHLQLGSEPGQALFRKMCAPCHTVGVGDQAGPDLLGVTDRRSADWLARFIRDPERLRREADADALDLVARFPGVRMPSFGLTENDAADLIAFLKTRTDEVMQARAEAIAHDSHHSHAADSSQHGTHGGDGGDGGHMHVHPDGKTHQH